MAKLLALWILVHVGGRVPVRVLYACAWLAGAGAWHLRPSVRAVTRDHMRRVLGADADPAEVDRHARRCSVTAAYYYADFARAYHASDDETLARIDDIAGTDHVFAAYDEGRGLILASAHLGNPEMISYVLDTLGLDLLVITEPLEPPRLHRFVHGVRAHKRDVRYVPASLQSLRATIAHLRAGGAVGLLIDRDVLGTGIPFPFFGECTRMPSGAVELARLTGAAFVVGAVLRTAPGRFRIELERIPRTPSTANREADVRAGMHDAVAAIERAISRDPGQWFALTPVWPDPPPPAPAEEPTPVEALQSER